MQTSQTLLPYFWPNKCFVTVIVSIAGAAAAPFGKGLSFAIPSSSSAAAPASSSGVFGAFGAPAGSTGFAAPQTSGAALLLMLPPLETIKSERVHLLASMQQEPW